MQGIILKFFEVETMYGIVLMFYSNSSCSFLWTLGTFSELLYQIQRVVRICVFFKSCFMHFLLILI